MRVVSLSGLQPEELASYQQLHRSQLHYSVEQFGAIRECMRQTKNGREFVVFNGNEAIAWANTRPDMGRCFYDVGLAEGSDAALAMRLLSPHLLQALREFGHNRMTSYAFDGPLRDHCTSNGGLILNELVAQELDFNNANRSGMQSWLESIPANNPELEAKLVIDRPAHWIEEYRQLFTHFLNSMPRQDAHNGPYDAFTYDSVVKLAECNTLAGITVYSMCLYHDGVLIGFTEAKIPAKMCAAHQGMTGIHADFRGRGLGKWLKAALFFELEQTFPHINTLGQLALANNSKIIELNKACGWQIKQRGAELELDLETLQRLAELR